MLKSQLIPTDDGDIGSTIGDFFKKLGKVYKEDPQSAAIYSGMLFTLVIWVVGALSLLLAVLFWIFFLWHYCPQSHGGLHGFCEKKSNKKLASIVSVKVNKAIEEEERKRRKLDAKAMKKGEQPQFGRQATLPTLFNPVEKRDEKPPLNRNDTNATLPSYTSRPTTPGGPTTATFELNDLESKRPPPSRTLTNTSYSSNAPLMGNASDMGYGRSESPAPSLPPSRAGYPAPIRTMTSSSQKSQWSQVQTPDERYNSPYDRPGLPSHMSTVSSGSQGSFDSYGQSRPERSYTPAGLAPSMGRRTPFNEEVPYPMDELPRPSEFGRNSPALSALGQKQYPQNRSASSASPAPYPTSPPREPQMRSVTEPYYSRPGTSQSNRPGMPQDYSDRSRTLQGNQPPMPQSQDYFGDVRSGTPQSVSGYERTGTSHSRRPVPQEYMERPGTSQSRRPVMQEYERPGTSQSRQPQEYIERPGTSQSRPPQEYMERPGTSQSRRPVPQDYERPGTSQSRRPVPSTQQSQGSMSGERQPRLPDLGDGYGR